MAVPVISFGDFLQMPESCNGVGGAEASQLKFLHVVFFLSPLSFFWLGKKGEKRFVEFRNYTVTSEG